MACPACASGTLHAGTPAGTTAALYGLPTYIAPAPSTPAQGTIVIITDAFGWTFANNRILADSYARKGPFRVLVPDFLAGADLSPAMLSVMDYLVAPQPWGLATLWKVWLALRAVVHMVPFMIGSRFGVTHPRVVAYMRRLREEDEQRKVGVAGFCWGGKHAFLLAHDVEKTASGKSLIDVAFAAHPSFLKLPADVEAVVLPMSVACAENDMQLSVKDTEVVKVGLEKKSKAECEVKVYEGATHGFAVRANPAIPKENEQGIEAEDQALSWFTKWFL